MAMIRTYTETYDMNTEEDCPTLIGIHTPIGTLPYRFLEPAFKMYMKYKYIGCDVTIVNAARLPVDPTEMGKLAGENYIDPRDTLNPIMFKGCHGESLGKVLDSMYNGLLATLKEESLDKETFNVALRNFYYTALGDDSWRKSPIQKTLNLKNLHPLVYAVSSNAQILPTNGLEFGNYHTNNPSVPTAVADTGNAKWAENGRISSAANGWASPQFAPTHVYDPSVPGYKYENGQISMFTSKMHRLGWLDTMQWQGQNVDGTDPVGTSINNIALLPKLFMGLLMLPPANLCRQYLRVIIRHRFKFARFRTITTGGVSVGTAPLTFAYGYHNDMTGNIPSSKEADPIESRALDDEPVDMEDDPIDG